MSGAREASAIARLQEVSLLAARQLAPDRSGACLLVVVRERPPQGGRIKLIAGMKSPLGELANVKAREDGRFDCAGYFPAMDVLAFCMAKLDELGAPCPVVVRGPGSASLPPELEEKEKP